MPESIPLYSSICGILQILGLFFVILSGLDRFKRVWVFVFVGVSGIAAIVNAFTGFPNVLYLSAGIAGIGLVFIAVWNIFQLKNSN